MYKKTGWGFALTALIIAGALYSISQIEPKYGIDLSGGRELVYKINVSSSGPGGSGGGTVEIAETVKTIIEQRLDTYGLKELSIATQGDDRIVIQIPGVGDAEGIKKQIEEAGIMEFLLEAPSSGPAGSRLATLIDEVRLFNQQDEDWHKLKEKGETDPATLLASRPKKGSEWQKLDREVQVYKAQMAAYKFKRSQVPPSEVASLERPIPPQWNVFPSQELVQDGSSGAYKSVNEPGGYIIVHYEDQYRVSGALLEDAYRTVDDKLDPAIGFSFKPAGAAQFGDLTQDHIGRNLTIVLDSKVIQNANIKSRIAKSGVIESGATPFDINYVMGVVNLLKGGSLPTEPVLISESQIGSLISQESIKTGLTAVSVALAIVLVFMLLYYMTGGIVAIIALSLNLVLIFAYVVIFRQTLTLPGIAGVILTIGMAVDANILIFEHVREEINKGKALAAALGAGYKRAFWVIFDSNLTTLITGIILFQFGTGPIKGFAITLIAGILASFFTAVFVTRLVLSFLLNRGILKSFSMLNLIGVPKIKFQSKRKAMLTLSCVLIIACWVIVIFRGEENYGIDFRGGTKVSVSTSQPIEQSTLEEAIQQKKAQSPANQALLNDVAVQALGEATPPGSNKYTRFSILVRSKELTNVADAQENTPAPTPPQPTTPEGEEKPSEEAEVSDVQKSIQAAREEQAAESANRAAVTRLIKEILAEKGLLLPNPFPPVDPNLPTGGRGTWVTSAPGEAFKIRVNLLDIQGDESGKPPLERIQDLLNAHLAYSFKSEAGAEGVANPFTGITATISQVGATQTLQGTEGAQGRTLTTADVLTSGFVPADPEIADVASAPTKVELENQIIGFFGKQEVQSGVFDNLPNNPFELSEPFPEIVSIGSRVANNLHQQAFIAFFIAVIAIIFYLSLRFELAFGLGAITALVHDVLVAIGILAVVDLITGNSYSFKINLPEVAALLTIIGYSVNDTIVVFDRIRENLRESKKTDDFQAIVDKSINQTLSRTVWTSITTAIVILALLIFGGDSIRGFALTFLVGLITGTYSSIFVASPSLMYFRKRAIARRERIKAELQAQS